MRRFLALLLSFAMVFSIVTGIGLTVAAEPTTGSTSQDNVESNVMHFIIENWHAVDSSGNAGGTNNVRVEGYIVPNGDGTTYTVTGIKGSVYVNLEKAQKGIVTISARPYKQSDGEEEKALESFVGFAIAAGHEAVVEHDDGSIQIAYKPYVHLVKAHAFYQHKAVMKTGSPDVGSSDPLDIAAQKDTAYIDGTKVYSTTEGMHTDKTASAIDTNDRRFNLDLEAWYVDEKAVKVGMVLDASGSMSWTAGEPEKIRLSDEEIDRLEIKVLEEKISGSSIAWKDYFLTDEQLNQILNPRNTDTSRLSTSGYTYYIYDPRDSVREYVPLGYWEGVEKEEQEKQLIGYYEFNEGADQDTGKGERTWLLNSASGKYAQIISQASLEGDVIFGNPTLRDGENGWEQNDGRDQNNGLLMSSEEDKTGFLLKESTEGILLDAKPTSGNFTISFTIRQPDGDEPTEPAEILYIGPIGSAASDGDYFRAIRGTGNDSKYLLGGLAGELNDTNILAEVFTRKSGEEKTYTVTLVFSEDQDGLNVTTYRGRDFKTTNRLEGGLSGYNIIFNGIADSYEGVELYVDDIVVYDGALSADEVKELVSDSSSTPSNVIATLGTKVIGSIKDCFQDSGWYYINHTNSWESYYEDKGLQSAKELYGVYKYLEKDISTLTFTDTLTESVYRPDKTTATLFYVDKDKNLCCFFANSVSKNPTEQRHGTSYVYEKDDADYTKVGALQRALGAFVTKLDEIAPSSEVSAVRFSTNEVTVEDNSDKLVLLNWTKNPSESLEVLSLERDKNNEQNKREEWWGGTAGDENGQYNYGLTGDTSTWRGLYAFQKELAAQDVHDSSKEKKYLIIFTDGKDTDRDNEDKDKAKNLAVDLKADGYIIFAVMLAGGAVDPNDGKDYQEAKEFLLDLVGYQGMNSEDAKDYFFSTKDEVNTTGDSVQELIEIFSEKIIDEITEQLDDYTVQDYIDPRFDLVDAKGNVWRLNGGGKVSVVNERGQEIETYEITKDRPQEIELSKDSDVDESARRAKLFYNDNMYYLKWQQWTDADPELNIPVVSKDAKQLNVWNARMTIQAKEDFIGGNAVLTNGHGEGMNYVYHKGDESSSSGTDNMKRDDGIDYPSKGFPRVVVNVYTPAPSGENADQIYMGEALGKTKEDILYNAKAAAEEQDEEDNTRTQWYWEYLIRYAENNNTTLDRLIAGNTDADGSATVTIPYYYLPNKDKTNPNQTGTFLHEKDQLGTLVYKWEGDYKGSATTDRSQKTATLTVTYTPLDVEVREKSNNGTEDENGINKNDGLIRENGVYKWDSDYKPVVGVSLENDDIAEQLKGSYTLTTDVVRGQIALQMVIGEDVVKYLQEHGEKKITYAATLKRSYGDGDIKDQVVGKLTVTYDIPALKAAAVNSATESGTVTEPDDISIVYDKDFPFDVAKDGLPIGTYTLVPNDEANKSALYKFSGITVVELVDGKHEGWFRYAKDNLDDESEDGAKLTDFEASRSGTSVLLGTDKSNGKTYTDERYALLEVEVEVHTGDLTVTKTVKGVGGDTKKDFTFTVTLDDTSIKGTFGDMTFKDGVAEFTLKHGEKKTAEGLPAGIKYTVKESDNDGYEVTSTGGSDKIKDGEKVTAAFTNTKIVGGLTVTKTVVGSKNDEEKDFTFTVTLSDKTINGTYGGMTFEDGVAIFTLKHGDKKTAENLPVGITYTVAESGNDGYKVDSTGATGVISETTAALAEFTNTRVVGRLTVTKTVTGSGGDTNQYFFFTVTLSDTTINGEYGDMSFADGIAIFKLKSGENKTAEGLPAGITYKVAESGNAGYEVTANGVASTITSGIIEDGEMATAAFTNTKEVGNLTVSKKVEGVGGDPNQEFTFKVTLDDKTITGIYGDMEFVGGVAMFTLKDSQSKTATGLPAGITYEVVEGDSDGYQGTATGDKGTITDGKTAAAEFRNETVGDLIVRKIVAGDAVTDPMQDEFSFTVTLFNDEGDINTSINGNYGDMDFTNGVATFKLKHEESKTAKGLPAGITFTVEESDNAGYEVTVNGVDDKIITGTITRGATADAEFINTMDEARAGDLIVEKKVVGDGVAPDQEFTFKVTLFNEEGNINTSITGTFGDMDFENGEATIKLKAGRFKKAEGIPAGITYEVVEEFENEFDRDSYDITATGETGVIEADKPKTAAFTNTVLLGSLTVSKTVTGTDSDKDKEFHFTVTLFGDGGSINTSVNGNYGDMEFTNGKATIMLKSGESKTATGLLGGITYTVEETEADDDGYKTISIGDTGMILQGKTATAEFINHRDEIPEPPPTGGLTVFKTVTGTAGETDKKFTFTVTLNEDVNGNYPDENGMYFDKGVATFTLKHGESKTATGLSAGITYTVIESDNDGYKVTATGGSGKLPENDTATAAFTNHKDAPPPKTGDLTVTKTVAGSAGNKKKDFTFTVTLDDTTINGTFGNADDGMTFTNGVATFTLKHGESKTAAELPAEINYTVVETDNKGYRVTRTGDIGTITEGKTLIAEFINRKDADNSSDDKSDSSDTSDSSAPSGNADILAATANIPQTGDNSPLMLWIALLTLSIVGMGTGFYFRKKIVLRGKKRNTE